MKKVIIFNKKLKQKQRKTKKTETEFDSTYHVHKFKEIYVLNEYPIC